MRGIPLVEAFGPSRGFARAEAGEAVERLAARREWGRTRGVGQQQRNQRHRSTGS